MSRSHQLAWAAGFFDGEGYIVIQRRNMKRNGKEYKGHYLRIGINHVAVEPLLEMQRIFGGSIEKQNPETVTGNRHPRHRWVTSTQNAADTLEQMMPYFKNKQEVASLALDFQATMQREGKTIKLPEEVLAYRESIKFRITELNARD